MAKKITIAGHKGGTAKTVSAISVSSALARGGKQTLLVDLDPQGHSTLGLGVEIGDGEFTLRDLFTEPPKPVTQVIKETRVPGLRILPSDIRLARVAQSLYMRPKREELLKRALQPAEREFDFIVMDCAPSLGVLTEAGIAAADFIIVPCLTEARAADALQDLLEVIEVIKGEAFDKWRILLTKFDTRKTVTIEAVMAALEPWKDKILKTVIPQSEPLNQAQIERTDIHSFDPKSKGALAYQELTKEILTHA